MDSMPRAVTDRIPDVLEAQVVAFTDDFTLMLFDCSNDTALRRQILQLEVRAATADDPQKWIDAIASNLSEIARRAILN